MKKLIFVETGKEVEIGKPFVFGMNSNHGFIPFYTITIYEESIPFLIEHDVIKEIEVEEKPSTDVNFYIEHLAKRVHWNLDNLIKYLGNLYIISPTSVFSILLREIAIVMDKEYPDHIERSKEIYVIDITNGEIHKLRELHKIKNFRNFAAFRTLKDALYAKHILKDFMKELFKKGGK